jgi:hypothetical protein
MPLKPLAIRPDQPPPDLSKPAPRVTVERSPAADTGENPLVQADPIPDQPTPLAPLPMTSVPKPTPTTPATPPSVDMVSDLPGTVPVQKRSPFQVDMEDFKLSGVPSSKSKKTMETVAELKKLVGLISRDLDAGGRERTRLIYHTEATSKEITALAELWPDVPPLVSACVKAKRSSLVLEEELRAEPRRWTHVRWAFQECQKEVKQLRRTAARVAALEPQLVRVVKKGKVYYVEPSKSPEELQREAEERRLQELKEERDRNRERQEELKDTKDSVPLKYGM